MQSNYICHSCRNASQLTLLRDTFKYGNTLLGNQNKHFNTSSSQKKYFKWFSIVLISTKSVIQDLKSCCDIKFISAFFFTTQN